MAQADQGGRGISVLGKSQKLLMCCVHPRDPVLLLPSKGSPSRDAAAGSLTTASYCRPPLVPLSQSPEGCSLGLPLKAVNCWSAPLWLFLQGWC